CLQDFQLPLTF
nr:immunoglobulin light chain junction region [Macaca mulatta]MOW40977.1 immunoglobulin light chain junction region [Macaca mulatta]MOW41061.1 immunoglobulin light chain junction region [Macaca mulatta]MOW41854.1 immunoglobulin light chain junction region [Macaca mulatta]MOW42094.1 immunoglobulin light chain junction region [Macaca mulatta]